MASAKIYNWKKEEVGQVDLDPGVFDVEVKNEVLHSVVRWQLACRRQGTHMTKTKGLVSGGGKKPFKQKGTGNARQGSTRSPLMPGGGTAFGPMPRSYAYALPKKMRRVGLQMALSYLKKEGRLFIMDKLTIEDGKTKSLNSKVGTFGIKKAVLLGKPADEMLKRAARNLKKVKYLETAGLNVYDLLKYDALLLDKAELASVVARCELGVNR